jgi:hypothetical protein
LNDSVSFFLSYSMIGPTMFISNFISSLIPDYFILHLIRQLGTLEINYV